MLRSASRIPCPSSTPLRRHFADRPDGGMMVLASDPDPVVTKDRDMPAIFRINLLNVFSQADGDVVAWFIGALAIYSDSFSQV